MKFSSLSLLSVLSLGLPVLAQNGDYANTVVEALNGAGLTTLATALQGLVGTEAGDALIARLQDDERTVFAPTNEAFAALGDGALDDTAALGRIISYHIVSDDVSDDDIPVSPGHDVADTFLSADLGSGDNSTVPLILTRLSDDSEDFVIFNNNDTIAVTGPTEVGNIQLYTIDRVIPLPPSLAELIESAGLTSLAPLLTSFNESQGPISGPLTIFAPNNEAFEAVASALEGLDEQAQFAVLQNHIVSRVLYSDDVADAVEGDDDDDDDNDDAVTPLAGPAFTVSSNDTGIFITSGEASAQVVATDYLFEGGVVHVIGSVLVNENVEANTPTGTTSGSPSATSSGTPQSSGATNEEDDNDGDDANSPSTTPNPASKVGWSAGATAGGLVVALSALIGGSFVL